MSLLHGILLTSLNDDVINIFQGRHENSRTISRSLVGHKYRVFLGPLDASPLLQFLFVTVSVLKSGLQRATGDNNRMRAHTRARARPRVCRTTSFPRPMCVSTSSRVASTWRGANVHHVPTDFWDLSLSLSLQTRTTSQQTSGTSHSHSLSPRCKRAPRPNRLLGPLTLTLSLTLAPACPR
jgi:hypothetical protein